MARRRELTDEEQATARQMQAQGMGPSEIATQFSVGRDAVARALCPEDLRVAFARWRAKNQRCT